MVAVVAKLKIKEGKIDEAIDLFKGLTSRVREEEGTLAYGICRDKANPNLLVIVERYKDSDALKAHGSSDYFKEFSKAIGQYLDGKTEVSILEEIASI